MSRDLAERVGEGHDHATLLEARRRTIAAVRDIAACVAPGMTEEEGTELACRALRAHGFERDWAAPYLRFGTNTLRKFGEPSEPGVVLGRDDLWFIDVGPLWRNHECDYADSFATGVDPDRQRIVRDLHAVFERTQAHWRASQATGAELYRFAAAEAAARGWQLDLEMAGHRLGEFPHAAFHDGLLSRAGFRPSAGLWMLEIQLRHPDKPYSAFFEDLLLDAGDE
ncbi:MAG TPA: M24 family metallopeptidase [Steroidobacteraceae bacterium]|jgi:Xaa-Pro aminopeptidase|nr:M24 family metallopeptidase [Steroidobacteraceae bacterium]